MLNTVENMSKSSVVVSSADVVYFDYDSIISNPFFDNVKLLKVIKNMIAILNNKGISILHVFCIAPEVDETESMCIDVVMFDGVKNVRIVKVFFFEENLNHFIEVNSKTKSESRAVVEHLDRDGLSVMINAAGSSVKNFDINVNKVNDAICCMNTVKNGLESFLVDHETLKSVHGSTVGMTQSQIDELKDEIVVSTGHDNFVNFRNRLINGVHYAALDLWKKDGSKIISYVDKMQKIVDCMNSIDPADLYYGPDFSDYERVGVISTKLGHFFVSNLHTAKSMDNLTPIVNFLCGLLKSHYDLKSREMLLHSQSCTKKDLERYSVELNGRWKVVKAWIDKTDLLSDKEKNFVISCLSSELILFVRSLCESCEDMKVDMISNILMNFATI